MIDIIDQLQQKAKTYPVRFRQPLDKAIIQEFEEKYFPIPEEYKEILSECNGIFITKYADCKIVGLGDVEDSLKIDKEMGDNYCFDNKSLQIGTFWEDELYIDQNNRVYLSFQGIDDPVCLDMTLKDFLLKCIDKNFEIFWDENIQIVN